MAQNQEQIEARLAAYIDGELDANERAEIEKHLANNPAHRELILELTAQRDLISALPHEKAPAEIYETLQGQLERSVLLGSGGEVAEEANMRINRWPHRGAIAAILLLATGLGFLVYKVLPSNKPPAEFAVATSQGTGPSAVPFSEDPKSDVALADGKTAEGAPVPAPLPGTAATEAPPSVATGATPPALKFDGTPTNTVGGAGGTSGGGGGGTRLAAAPTPSPAVAPTLADQPPAAAATPALAPSASLTPEAQKPGALDSIATAEKSLGQSEVASKTAPKANSIESIPPAPTAPAGVLSDTNTIASAQNGSKQDASKIAPKEIATNAAPTTPSADSALALSPTPSPLNETTNTNAGNRPLANAMSKSIDRSAKDSVGGDAKLGQTDAGAMALNGGVNPPLGTNAGAVSAGSITLLVSTDDTSIAREQVQAYLESNKITWEAQAAPMQYADADRFAFNRSDARKVDELARQERQKATDVETMRDNSRGGAAHPQQAERRVFKGGEEIPAEATPTDEAKSERARQVVQPNATPTTSPASPVVTGATANNNEIGSVQATQQKQVDVADARTAPFAFYCRAVTPDQAKELETVLSSRVGQAAQVVAPDISQSAVLDQTLNAQLQVNAAPTTAPTTQTTPTVGQATGGFTTMKDQLAQPADKNGFPAGGNNFDLQQKAGQQNAAQQDFGGQQQAVAPNAPDHVDLLIVVRRELTATTQPAAAEPVSQPAPTQAPAPSPTPAPVQK